MDPTGHVPYALFFDGVDTGMTVNVIGGGFGSWDNSSAGTILAETSTSDVEADGEYIEDSEEVDQMMQTQPEDGYAHEMEAAQAALQVINPQSKKIDREYGGWIIGEDGRYFFTEPKQGTQHSIRLGKKPDNAVAYYHSHGARTSSFDEKFSPLDKQVVRCKAFWHNSQKMDGACLDRGYLITPSGAQLVYDPNEKWRRRVTGFIVLKRGFLDDN